MTRRVSSPLGKLSAVRHRRAVEVVSAFAAPEAAAAARASDAEAPGPMIFMRRNAKNAR